MYNFLHLLPLLLFFLPFSKADYFSEGWKPGHAAVSSTTTSVEVAYTPAPLAPASAEDPKLKLGLMDRLIISSPINGLLNSMGINMTQKVLDAKEKEDNLWDRRIPLITDENYNELLVDAEPSTEDEVWFIIISTTSGKKDTLSTIFDERFDEAYNITAEQKDLRHVKWGRIDYFGVTRITTKWNVWRGPMLVVASDKGKTLRFLNARQLRPDPKLMRGWLEDGGYLKIQPWQSNFGPGGNREWMLDGVAVVCEKWYNAITLVPTYVLYIGTGAIATFLVQFMHRGSIKKQERERQQKLIRQKAAQQQPSSGKPQSKGVTAKTSEANAPRRSPRNKK